MAAPIVPEPVVTPPAAAPNPSPSTPPVVNPAPTNFREELDRLGRGALSTLHNQLAEAKAKIQQLETSRTTEAPRPTGAEFLNDPVPIIQAELRNTVQPLKEFVEQMQAERRYDSAKTEIKRNYPALGAKFAELEPYVDQLMRGIDPSPQNIQAAFTQALGLQQLGQIPAMQTGAPNAQPVIPAPVTIPSAPPVPTMPIPPSIPPSPPTLPVASPNAGADAALKAKVDAMTEDERKIARMWGQTPEQFISLRDASSEVSSWPQDTK